MIVASGIAMQFGAKPLFSDVSVKFGGGDRYGLGVPTAQHQGPMSAVAPGWKLRVLLAQVLFGDPDILLLDEPTNNLDINSIRWLEDVLNRRTSTMVIISHDRHFLSSVCRLAA